MDTPLELHRFEPIFKDPTIYNNYPTFFLNGIKFEIVEREGKQNVVKKLYRVKSRKEKAINKQNQKCLFIKSRESEQKWALENYP